MYMVNYTRHRDEDRHILTSHEQGAAMQQTDMREQQESRRSLATAVREQLTL